MKAQLRSSVGSFGDTSNRKGWEPQIYRNRLYRYFMLVYAFKTPCVYEYSRPCAENQQLDFSLFICLDVSLFHPSLSPHSPQNPVIFGRFFFYHSSRCFLPLALSWLCCLHFFSSNFFLPLLCHFLSLSFRPASLPTVIFILYPLRLSYCCSKIRQALFCVMGAAQN